MTFVFFRLAKSGLPLHLYKAEVSKEELKSIAKEENYTIGRWDLFVSWSKADQYWQMMIKDFLQVSQNKFLFVTFKI
jgi:hypothetical protein